MVDTADRPNQPIALQVVGRRTELIDLDTKRREPNRSEIVAIGREIVAIGREMDKKLLDDLFSATLS